jgi:hypothetical protein
MQVTQIEKALLIHGQLFNSLKKETIRILTDFLRIYGNIQKMEINHTMIRVDYFCSRSAQEAYSEISENYSVLNKILIECVVNKQPTSIVVKLTGFNVQELIDILFECQSDQIISFSIGQYYCVVNYHNSVSIQTVLNDLEGISIDGHKLKIKKF